MNIQIFGVQKCFDTKKAERYFKERNIKYQFIDLNIKSFGKRELESIIINVKLSDLINIKSSLYDKLNIRFIRNDEIKKEILLNNAKLCNTPIVRNGKFATVGYKPQIWESWE
ncbi:ArsC family transcriptional regulator [Clostridium sp. 19966]|uniref:arsenate reductase family protein n=1 Tax=Clostridium sp. 19966 TaxID=2768166 RepID=UPI0028DEE5DA|nr:ArsC/Spx/MgsR family protein [Clostridium sp. 19966]MDT8716484.1 ArsC family transcriptional regulator [Clostridium sp. 19966]